MDEINIKDSLKITPMQIGQDTSTVQLVLNGYLDTYNSPEFQSHIVSMINSGVRNILFNCNGLNYISSTGIGAFTSFLKLLKQKKGAMVLFGLQKKVYEVFQLLGFTKFFVIAETFEDALRELNKVMLKEKLTVEKKPVEGQAERKEEGKESIFPFIFQCPHCGKKLKTPKPGKFRCANCKGIIKVDSGGEVSKLS